MRAEQTGFPSIDKPWLKYYSEEVIIFLKNLVDIAETEEREKKD